MTEPTVQKDNNTDMKDGYTWLHIWDMYRNRRRQQIRVRTLNPKKLPHFDGSQKMLCDTWLLIFSLNPLSYPFRVSCLTPEPFRASLALGRFSSRMRCGKSYMLLFFLLCNIVLQLCERMCRDTKAKTLKHFLSDLMMTRCLPLERLLHVASSLCKLHFIIKKCYFSCHQSAWYLLVPSRM